MSEDRLDELLRGVEDDDNPFGGDSPTTAGANKPTPPAPQIGTKMGEYVSQWALGGNGRYFPIGKTEKILASGVYSPIMSGDRIGVELLPVNSDGIYTLPDMPTEEVLREVETFWNNEDRYRNHNLLYKRGILLYGPPGSGKTIAVKMLMKEIIRREGVVLLGMHMGLTIQALKILRDIEPKRSIIIVLEDIDEIINYNGEASVLSLLDGEHNVDNVLNLATTNYPERLGARVINRPSRFDRRVYVGMPNDAARECYLLRATNGNLNPEQVKQWVVDSEGMSIAHLRELVAAVYCLDQDYGEVIDRLKKMCNPVKATDDGFAHNSMGFKSGAKRASSSDN